MMVVSARHDVRRYRIRSTTDPHRYLLATSEFGRPNQTHSAIEFFDVHNACDIAEFARKREPVEVVKHCGSGRYIPIDS